MKKQDLQIGKHGVETRDGKRYLVLFSDYSQKPFLLGSDSYAELDDYMDNFRHHDHHGMDIVKVFNLVCSSLKYQRLDEETVWEEDDEQACKSKIADAEDKIARHEYRIEVLLKEIKSIKKRLTQK
jgi:hypothetical protein